MAYWSPPSFFFKPPFSIQTPLFRPWDPVESIPRAGNLPGSYFQPKRLEPDPFLAIFPLFDKMFGLWMFALLLNVWVDCFDLCKIRFLAYGCSALCTLYPSTIPVASHPVRSNSRALNDFDCPPVPHQTRLISKLGQSSPIGPKPKMTNHGSDSNRLG